MAAQIAGHTAENAISIPMHCTAIILVATIHFESDLWKIQWLRCEIRLKSNQMD
jgi:hypothetical protein